MGKTPNEFHAWRVASVLVFPEPERNYSPYWLGDGTCSSKYIEDSKRSVKLRWKRVSPYHCRVIGLLMAAEYAKCLTRKELRSFGYNV